MSNTGRPMRGSHWTNDETTEHLVAKCEFCEKHFCRLHQSETCPHRFYDE